MTQNWSSVKVSRGHNFSWEKGKTERRIEALGAPVVLDQWDRPAPGDAQAKDQDKGFYDITKCHPNLSVEEGDTQDQTQEVPTGKGLFLADDPVWKGIASRWFMNPHIHHSSVSPWPQACSPDCPHLFLSPEFDSLTNERWQAIAYIPCNQTIRHFPGDYEQ